MKKEENYLWEVDNGFSKIKGNSHLPVHILALYHISKLVNIKICEKRDYSEVSYSPGTLQKI